MSLLLLFAPQGLVGLETWSADESQRLNVDIVLSANLAVYPTLIAPPAIYAATGPTGPTGLTGPTGPIP